VAKGWYVLHVYSGHENKVEKYIQLLINNGEFSEHVTDVKVPAEDVVEVKNGKKRTVSRKFLPGYILVEMDLPERGWKAICTSIRRIQGVTGFVGTSKDVRPQPISQDEVKAILQKSGAIKTEKRFQSSQDFTLGEEVKIIDGPFESFTGKIELINQEKGKLKVMVGIFGRSTPVEVNFTQVEKI
jgi:transcriptional antiterminator NusG